MRKGEAKEKTGDDSGGTYILVRAGAMVASKREGCGAGWGLGWRCLAGGEVSESAVVVGREMGDRRGWPALKGPPRALLASPLLASAQSDVTVRDLGRPLLPRGRFVHLSLVTGGQRVAHSRLRDLSPCIM